MELVAVLLLLSLGFLALANMFRVTYRAFDKAEERYVKQEEVKLVAEMLRQGSTNVAASTYADIFDTTTIIPTKDSIDPNYSYLYFEPHKACDKCGSDWNVTDNECTNESGTCDSTKSKVDGYFLKCLNSGTKRNCDLENIPCSEEHCECPNTKSHYCKDCSLCNCLDKAFQLSTVPIYVSFRPMTEELDNLVKDPETGETIHLDDWRLPTAAEIGIIYKYQGTANESADAIDYLLNAGAYFSASGPVTNPDSNSTGKSIRCIRDAY